MIEHIRALAADIDMTLTAKGSGLPKITQEAFDILHRNGVLLGLATGREVDEKVRNMGKTWGLGHAFDFIIGMNGGQIYDLSKDRLDSVPFMSREEMKEILEYMMPLIDRYQIAINAEGGGNHNAMNIGPELMASSARHGFVFIDKTGDIDGFCERPAFKMLFRTEAQYEQEIRDTFLKKFGDRDQIIGTYPGTVEIMHKDIDKGSGMKKYADSIGLAMKDVIAFGDNENDNTLLKDCGWGVCLLNGAEGTKACADAVTEKDCESGGVGHYLFDHYITPHHLK